MHIKKIVIVGGGSAGWMTAAGLIKQTPNIDLTLIESKNIPTVGVGESTLAWINKYFDILGIEDEDWMKHCQATYKHSIKFTNWTHDENAEAFHYPFGQLSHKYSPNGFVDFMQWKLHDEDVKPHNFAEFHLESLSMSKSGKMTKNENNEIEGFDFKYDTAYHMDATLFGQYLKNHICLNNINYIQDDVINIIQNEDESIKHLETASGDILEADLFIDCTGFKSLLLGETLKVPFASYKNVLINDKALAAQIPYIDKEKEMEPTTNCTAIENGWCWNTPLWNRIGTGYVYSSKFVSDEQAEREFRNHLASSNMVIGDKKRAEEVEMFKLNIKHGIHEKIWHKNVVAIGLSAGFIEPLESTGLLSVHENIIFLLKTLLKNDGIVGSLDEKNYNFVVHDVMNQFAIFVSQHYALSSKRNTPYWKHVTENIEYDGNLTDIKITHDGFVNTYNVLGWAGLLDGNFTFDTTSSGLVYIMAGHNQFPYTKIDEIVGESRYGWPDNHKITKKTYENGMKELNKIIDSMDSHYIFLKKTLYKK